jgi:DNA repair protein SbcC/Rad50
MLTYNYELIREEYGKDSKQNHPASIKFSPIFPRKINSIAMIKGRNSKGKSTLLHIVALGLYGLKNDNIHKSLNEKMRSLIDSDYQNLTYEFTIENKQHDLKIISKKPDRNSREIIVCEVNKGGIEKPISFEKFRSKYHLIYDIPNDPIGRLNELVSELKSNQNLLGNRLMQFNVFVKGIIQDVNNSKDPLKIKENKRKLDNLSKEIEEDIQGLNKIKDETKLFSKFTYYKFLVEYIKKKNQEEINLNSLEKSVKSIIKDTKKKIKQGEEEYKKGLEFINLMKGDINDLVCSIKKNLSDDKEKLLLINSLEKLNIQQTMIDEDRNESIISILEYYEELFNNKKSNISIDSTYQAADLYKHLIELLNEYINLDVVLPGVEKNIKEFLKILRDEWKKYEVIGVRRENFDKILDLIKDIKARREYFIKNSYAKKINTYINTDKENDGEKFTENELKIYEINTSKKVIENCKEKINKYYNRLIKINEIIKLDDFITIRNNLRVFEEDPLLCDYLDWDEKQLNEKVDNLIEDVNSRSSEIETKKTRFNILKRDFDQMNSKEEHIFINDLDFLNKLFKISQELSGLVLNDFDLYLDKIRNKDVNYSDSTYSNYATQVSKYLASKVGSIKYFDGNDLEIDTINLMSEEIKTKDKRIMHLKDLGVGHSQAAYLSGILNSSDNRKIIALIDETAMMDNNTIKRIVDKLKSLYNEGKLILGLVVRQDEYEEVENFI